MKQYVHSSNERNFTSKLNPNIEEWSFEGQMCADSYFSRKITVLKTKKRGAQLKEISG